MTFVPPGSSYRGLRCLLFCALILIFLTCRAEAVTENLSPDLTKAQQAMDDDDIVTAEKILLRVLKEDDSASIAHRLLGILYLNQGRRGEAALEFQKALINDPLDEMSKELLFSVYYNQGQELFDNALEAPKARSYFEQAAAIRPEGVMSYYYLGSLNYQENRDAECVDVLLKIVKRTSKKLTENIHHMIYNCAFNLLNQKNSLAAKDVVPYLAASPDTTTDELLLAATISLENKDFPQAIQLYSQVLSKDPQHALALYNRDVAKQRLTELLENEQKKSLDTDRGSHTPKNQGISSTEKDQTSNETVK